MKNESAGKPAPRAPSELTLFRVKRVKVSNIKEERFDKYTFETVQDAGFVGLKGVSLSPQCVVGESPSDDVFVLEVDSKAFQLFRVCPSKKTKRLIDAGYITYFPDELDGEDEIVEIAGCGHRLNDWQMSCTKASDDLVKLNDSMETE